MTKNREVTPIFHNGSSTWYLALTHVLLPFKPEYLQNIAYLPGECPKKYWVRFFLVKCIFSIWGFQNGGPVHLLVSSWKLRGVMIHQPFPWPLDPLATLRTPIIQILLIPGPSPLCLLYGYPCEHQNSWVNGVHPPKQGLNKVFNEDMTIFRHWKNASINWRVALHNTFCLCPQNHAEIIILDGVCQFWKMPRYM